VGVTVGYRMRGDTRVGPHTRIEVLTEGVLTRVLQHDPALDGVSLVIFDEFHERSLHADIGLALALQAQQLLRPDLRLLVMSATLDGQAVAALLGGAPVIASEGRAFPVEPRWLDRPLARHATDAAVRMTERALARHPGDILVFLPGAAEIHRAHQALEACAADVYPLHGSLPFDQQDRAIRPSPPGRRKVVLATSIAETSLTIEGITVVVDSGLMRVPRFSPRTGMTRLDTVRVTRAAAEQRAGRAGRLAPGLCYRLWTEAEHASLLAHSSPEILEADLAPLALDLAAWGVDDPALLRWLDPPPAAAFAQARELLRELGALDAAGRITPHGRALGTLPVHPRLAHMLRLSPRVASVRLAAELAALLEERDIFRRADGPADPDLRLRVEALRTGRGPLDPAALARVRREARQWETRLGARQPLPAGGDDVENVGVLLALAYPDRIAQRRPGSRDRVLLRSGRGAVMAATGALATAEYVVAAQLDDRGGESRIFLAAPLERADIERWFAADIATTRTVELDEASGAVRARLQRCLGAIVLAESADPAVTPDEVAEVLANALRRRGLASLDWTRDSSQLRGRIALLHQLEPARWPDVSDAALLADPRQWLLSHAPGARSLDALRRVPLQDALLGLLDWRARRTLDEQAPTHWTVPSGSRIPIDYSDPVAPVLAVRLQEMFGALDTPRIAGGRVPLTLHLLSPAHRPVQITRDLASFWKTAYFEVRKDLKGRYPKHYWPDDPLVAEPTRRTRPRG
jgi:ATP-dependent helicase HrpB